VELLPDSFSPQNTLGLVELRNGNLREAASALQKSMEKKGAGGDAYDWFQMAILSAQKGLRDEARRWFDKAVAWSTANGRRDADLRVLWAEAADQLGEPGPVSIAPIPSEKVTAPAAPASDAGFRPLFNGKDLTGWKTHPSQRGEWRVESGNRVCSGPPTSHLYTVRDDFEVTRAQFRRFVEETGTSIGRICLVIHEMHELTCAVPTRDNRLPNRRSP